MAFDSLSEKLQDAFKSLKGKGKITEEDVNLASVSYTHLAQMLGVLILLLSVQVQKQLVKVL